MSQTTGDLIRSDIRIILEQKGYKTTSTNVEKVMTKHLGDSLDRPLEWLIDGMYDLEK